MTASRAITPAIKCGRIAILSDSQICLEDSLVEDSVYFPLASNLYNNVTQAFPNSNIWLTGHSLGGCAHTSRHVSDARSGLAALMSLTFGVPAVTFESPGDLMAAKRLQCVSGPCPG